MNKNKKLTFKLALNIVLTVFFAILVLNSTINIVRILFVDRLSNLEVYHYPQSACIEYQEEKKDCESVFYINEYLYKMTVHRIDEQTAQTIFNSPKVIITLDGHKFYLSENDEIVFSLHTHFIRERSLLDKLFMIVFYDNTDNLYYSSTSNKEHFDNVMTWFEALGE